jgi:hypothetical protein
MMRRSGENVRSVRDHEPLKARARHANRIVRFWRISPIGRDVAERISSVSLKGYRSESQ